MPANRISSTMAYSRMAHEVGMAQPGCPGSPNDTIKDLATPLSQFVPIPSHNNFDQITFYLSMIYIFKTNN